MKNDLSKFKHMRNNKIQLISNSKQISECRLDLQDKIQEYGYSYLWDWMGVPVIQTPEDLLLLSEIIFSYKPHIVIETGFARGGSAVFMYSLMKNYILSPTYIGIDIEFREHNLSHLNTVVPDIYKNLNLFEGCSVSDEASFYISKILNKQKTTKRMLVHLDSNHTEKHVLSEIKFYDQFLQKGDILIVGDTVIEELTNNWQGERPWGPGNNPYTAILKSKTLSTNYSQMKDFDSKSMFSSNRNGYFIKI